jgi:hypothetical protein
MRLSFSPLHLVCLIAAPVALGAGCGKANEQPSGIRAAGDGAPAAGSGAGDHGSSTAGSGGRSASGSVAGASGSLGTVGAAGTRSDAGASGAAAGTAGRGRGDGSASGRGDGAAGTGGAAASGNPAGRGSTAGNGTAAGSGGAASHAPGCGTRGSVQCGADQFCNTEPDTDCGATDRGGVCATKSQVCTDIYKPVCGCDDHTYSNDCTAHAAGVSVKTSGMCGAPAAGRTCGGFAALACDPGQFCNYETAAGGQGCDGKVSDAGGTCEAKPSNCAADDQRVCGCDHQSYLNRCEAHVAGIAVLHAGFCTADDCAAIGGRVAYGTGPAAMCNADETEHGAVIENDGSLPIEGALCCLK